MPTSVLVSDTTALNAFDIEWTDEKDLNRLFPVVAKLEFVGRGAYGINRKGWPQFLPPFYASLNGENGDYLKGLKPEALTSDAFDKGKITFSDQKGKYLPISDLGPYFSKPLKIHWWFERLAVAVSAREATEATFLQSIANAIGATFVNSPKEYRLDFDPKAYRHRALDSLSMPRNVLYPHLEIGKRYQQAVDGLLKATITVLTDSQLTTAFKKPNGSISIEVNDPRLEAAVGRKIEMVEEFAKLTDPSVVQVARAMSSQLAIVDWDAKFHVIFGPPGSAGIDAPIKGSKGRTVL